jgi:DNA-binding transcriptional regulator YhcF (GntR family)
MGLLDTVKKPIPIVKTENEFNAGVIQMHPETFKEVYQVEIDLDDGKVINTKPTRKSRLAKSSPDRIFSEYDLDAISQYIESRIGNGCKRACGLNKKQLKEFMRTKIKGE